MIRFVTIAAALAVLCGRPGFAAAEAPGLIVQPADPAPTEALRRPDRDKPEARPLIDDDGRLVVRPKPEPPPRPHPRPRPHYWPYYFYGERRYEAPEREVVVIEKPAPAPEAPPEPPAPAPRIDACRTDPARKADEVGSGRVRFMEPPEDGCPRFSRAPSAEAPRLPTMDVAPAQ